jgi:hypothetical protein
MRRLLAIVALATLVACDEFDPLVDNTVTGTWRGSAAGQTFLVVMQQSGTSVAGNGKITNSAAVESTISVSGTFNQPSFAGTFTPNGAQSITYIATLEGGRTMVGTLSGGGFNGTGLALTRD